MGLFINIPMGLSYFYGGKLADNIGYKKVLLITRPVLVLPPILFALSLHYNEIQFTYLANFSVGVTLGATLVAVNALIMEYAPETKRASYISVHAMTIGIVAFLSSTIIGLILQKLAGDGRPPNELIVTLLLIVAGMRLFGNIGYYFVPCPDSMEK
jgi:MFS family permease